jgi:pyruvate decarboxylase
MKGVLRKLIDRLPRLEVKPGPKAIQNLTPESSMDSPITHRWFWPRLGQWLREGDIVLTETGTSNYGIFDTRFPKNVTNISQILWGSIGYATGACQGVALAAKELGGTRRTILFTGDGSFQLTCQEVSTMIRHSLNPIIFVVCNNGYTIERFIHGMEACYNDIQNWRYKDLVPAFGAEAGSYKTFQVKTKDEVDRLLRDEGFSKAPYIQLVELYIPWDDSPAGRKFRDSQRLKAVHQANKGSSLCNSTGQRPQQCQNARDMMKDGAARAWMISGQHSDSRIRLGTRGATTHTIEYLYLAMREILSII